MTRSRLESTWQRLASEGSGQGPYHYLQLESGDVAIGAIVRSADHRPGLLIRFSAEDWSRTHVPNSGRGLTFEGPLSLGPGAVGLAIVLAEPTMIDLFAQMGADLLEYAAEINGRSDAPHQILSRIGKWRRFLQAHAAPLTNEEVQGLFSELAVLRSSIVTDGARSTLRAWKGPQGGLHDFEFHDLHFEVKSWRVGGAGRLRISQLGQVVVDSAKPMILVAVQIAIDVEDGRSLPESVADVRALIDVDLRDEFDGRLAEAGYLEAHAAHYGQRLRVVRTDAFAVVDDFPRIDPLVVSGGITDVQYSIDIGALAPFRTNHRRLDSM